MHYVSTPSPSALCVWARTFETSLADLQPVWVRERIVISKMSSRLKARGVICRGFKMPVVLFVLCPLYRGKSVLYIVLSYLSPSLVEKYECVGPL